MKKNNNFSFDDLMSEIEEEIRTVLDTKVKNTIIGKAKESVQENVLDVYEPIYYKRRSNKSSLKGLKNKWESTTTKTSNSLNLKIKNIAKPFNTWEGVKLDEAIEYGTSTEQDAPIYKRPRPFIEPVQEELENTDIIEKILKENISYIK